MKTTTPILLRESIASVSTRLIRGTVPDEPAGTIVYVYLNMRRAGTTVVQSGTSRAWALPIERLSFGGGPAKLKDGDRLYVQARSVGKEMSDPTPIYTINGLDQPSGPYVLDEVSGTPRSVYERDSLLQGDVPLLLDYSVSPPVQKQFLPDLSREVLEGVTVSIHIEGAFLAQVQTDRNGHWVLDLTQISSHPLLPLKKGQLLSVKARRATSPLAGLPEQVVYPSAESKQTPVLSGFFENRIFDYATDLWRADDRDTGGDLENFMKVLALTMDEVKSYIDTFPAIFDISRCDPKYFGAIAALLGYPLNRLDSVESQRFQLANAIQFWRKKGTVEVFRILFYLLDYDIDVIELWTQDYKVMHPVEDVGYPKADFPEGPPTTAPELVENGGTWYKTPYFGIVINPITAYTTPPSNLPYQIDRQFCLWETSGSSVSLSLDDLRYLLERIDYFRPAHTVLDFIKFILPIQECGPLPTEKLLWMIQWNPEEPGWYLPYCNPDDPIYYRDGLRSTRPDGKGTMILGVTRDPNGPNAPSKSHINMKRFPERGYCFPPEDLVFDLQPTEDENYWFYLRRDGMGPGMYPLYDPLVPGTIDMNDWPSRNPLTDPPTRDGKFRYVSRLEIRLESYQGV